MYISMRMCDFFSSRLSGRQNVHICCAKSKTTTTTAITFAIRSVYRVSACACCKGSAIGLTVSLIAQLPLIATVVFYLQQQPIISAKYVEFYISQILSLLIIYSVLFFLLYNSIYLFIYFASNTLGIC